MSEPQVSLLCTVYNKAGFLKRTVASVRQLMPNEADIEYVFVDDCSSDHLLDIIRGAISGAPNVQIIENHVNRGPAVRINQAARAANGAYLYFIDSDDLAAPRAAEIMLSLLHKEKADVIYGKTEKRPLLAGEDPPPVPAAANYTSSDRPLETILGGGFIRMAMMARKDIYLTSGGADESILSQDESIALRLGIAARKLIQWNAKIVFRQPDPIGAQHISSNQNQLHHDAFLSAVHAMHELPRELGALAPKLYARAISQHWKMRKRYGSLPLVSRDFWRYQFSRGGRQPNAQSLEKMRKDFANLEKVRRIAQ